MSEYTETHTPNSDEELEEYMEETLRLLNENTAKQLESNHETPIQISWFKESSSNN